MGLVLLCLLIIDAWVSYGTERYYASLDRIRQSIFAINGARYDIQKTQMLLGAAKVVLVCMKQPNCMKAGDD